MRSAEATLIVGEFHPDLHAIAAHRVVALGGGIELFQPDAMPGFAAMIQDHLLV
jgi:hypothetical protein